MKRIIIYISLTFFYTIVLSAQSDYGLQLIINDSILILDNKRQDALKVNSTLEFTEDIDNLVLYGFNPVIIPGFFASNSENKGYDDNLIHVIEDSEGEIIGISFFSFSYRDEDDEFRSMSSRYFVNKRNLKVKHKFLNDCDLFRYDLGKFTLQNNKQQVVLYPILYRSNPFYDKLDPQKEYYLYFIYRCDWYYGDSINEKERQCNIEVHKNSAQFVGRIHSNKVKLIIK